MSDVIVEVIEEQYQVTIEDEDNIVVTVGEQGPEGIPGASTASAVAVTPYGPITATTAQGAIEQLADQLFKSATAPISNVEEGDLWYDTSVDVLKVYKNGSWINMILEPDLTNASLDGGYF